MNRTADTLLALCVAAAGASAASAAACPLRPGDGQQLTGDGVTLAWQVINRRHVPLAEPFALLVMLCPAQARLVGVDATMPAHRHGMNYRPSLQALGEGRWQVQGLLWHMAGTWSLRLDVALNGRTQVLRQDVVLP